MNLQFAKYSSYETKGKMENYVRSLNSPKPPISPAHRSDKISPYRLGMTSTSYLPGSWTIFKQTVSKYLSSKTISGYLPATLRQHVKKRPSDILMILALWTAVTCKNNLSRYITSIKGHFWPTYPLICNSSPSRAKKQLEMLNLSNMACVMCMSYLISVPDSPPLEWVLGAWMTFKKAKMAKNLRSGLSMSEMYPLNYKWLDLAI